MIHMNEKNRAALYASDTEHQKVVNEQEHSAYTSNESSEEAKPTAWEAYVKLQRMLQ